MKPFLIWLIEMLAIVAGGYLISTTASPETATTNVLAANHYAQQAIISYAVAGLGFACGFLVWYAIKGKHGFADLSLRRCLIRVILPVVGVLVTFLIKGAPELLKSFQALMGRTALPFAFTAFLIAGTLLHLLMVVLPATAKRD